MKIGDLFFGAKVEDFQPELVKQAQKAGDAAGQTLGQRLSGGLKSAVSGLGPGLGLGAGIAAFGGLSSAVSGAVGWLKDAAQEAMNDEASVSRLTASLKANVPAWDGNTDAIERNIEQKQALGFSDEELRDSLSVLAGATHDVAKAQEIQNTAMDLARFKNIDLKTASEALIKVEGGAYRSLKQLGIKLREGATSTEALAAVQAVASGQAQAYGDTTAGAAEAAGIAFGELQEDVGKVLLPVLKDLAIFARKTLIPAIRGIGDAIGSIADPTKAASDGVTDWLDVLSLGFDQLTGGPLRRWTESFAVSTEEVEENLGRQADAVSMFGADAAAALAAGEPGVRAASDFALSVPITDAVKKADAEAAAKAREIPGNISKALIAGQEDLKSGLAALKDLMGTSLSDLEKIAYARAVLVDPAVKAALLDERADVRAGAMQLVDDANEVLRSLVTGAADAAVDAGTTIDEQLRLQREKITAAMFHALQGARMNLASGWDMPTVATPKPAAPSAQPRRNYQTGTLSVPATGIYGLHAGELVAPPGIAAALRSFFGGKDAGMGGAGGSGVGTTYIVNVDGLLQAERPEDIGRVLRRLDALGMAS